VLQFVCGDRVVKDTGKEEYLRPEYSFESTLFNLSYARADWRVADSHNCAVSPIASATVSGMSRR